MKQFHATALAVTMAWCVSATQAAEVTAADFKLAIQNLEDSVQEAELSLVLTDLAKFAEIDEALVRKAMVEQKRRYSDVVIADLIAKKEKKKLPEVLEANPKPDWFAACQKAGVPHAEAMDKLDRLCGKVSVLTYTQQKKRKKRR